MDALILRAAACECIGKMIHEYREKGEHDLADGMILARRYGIKCLPAVDAVPVAHGRWIETTIPANTTGHGGVGQDKKKGRLCSNCKCAFDAVLLWCDSFCPHCGAKMDGEQRQEETP